MIAVCMIDCNSKSINLNNYEIKEAPSIAEAIEYMNQVDNWADKLVELELWCNLAILASQAMQTGNLRYAHSRALLCVSYFEKNNSESK
jgi:hypothetical protein